MLDGPKEGGILAFGREVRQSLALPLSTDPLGWVRARQSEPTFAATKPFTEQAVVERAETSSMEKTAARRIMEESF